MSPDAEVVCLQSKPKGYLWFTRLAQPQDWIKTQFLNWPLGADPKLNRSQLTTMLKCPTLPQKYTDRFKKKNCLPWLELASMTTIQGVNFYLPHQVQLCKATNVCTMKGIVLWLTGGYSQCHQCCLDLASEVLKAKTQQSTVIFILKIMWLVVLLSTVVQYYETGFG